MTDDLKLRQWDRCWPGNINLEVAVDEALARITDLEAKLQRLGRELNLAKYGEPDFAWEIHRNAVADLEARLAAAEAGGDALAEALKPFYEDTIQLPTCHCSDCKAARALAAYEARRKG